MVPQFSIFFPFGNVLLFIQLYQKMDANEYNNFRPEALTSAVMKCFDICVLPLLKADVSR